MADSNWHKVGDVTSLSRRRCHPLYAETNKNDDLVLLFARGQFHAMEAWCSHLGGPLFKGDIEDFQGRPHIMCPWHGYMFDVEKGTNSIGLRQEVFPTKVEEGHVWVQYKCPLKLEPIGR
ncbi:hypothetical protein CAPTEDRAFT_159559 [Capitella teleta]|uniref:Rieske domain-containing protein n=1 Tax=Capitella teleta TaxID=283909 RepID=R7T4X1_CAPTE|nr:hypothetical protein CAPTEDRAFT_159559 [Capitella teleta]|eukprot:ELT88043.1 hypothetical protein CAPTEDRAFT_159559 [Capitella teleta]